MDRDTETTDKGTGRKGNHKHKSSLIFFLSGQHNLSKSSKSIIFCLNVMFILFFLFCSVVLCCYFIYFWSFVLFPCSVFIFIFVFFFSLYSLVVVLPESKIWSHAAQWTTVILDNFHLYPISVSSSSSQRTFCS